MSRNVSSFRSSNRSNICICSKPPMPGSLACAPCLGNGEPKHGDARERCGATQPRICRAPVVAHKNLLSEAAGVSAEPGMTKLAAAAARGVGQNTPSPPRHKNISLFRISDLWHTPVVPALAKGRFAIVTRNAPRDCEGVPAICRGRWQSDARRPTPPPFAAPPAPRQRPRTACG